MAGKITRRTFIGVTLKASVAIGFGLGIEEGWAEEGLLCRQCGSLNRPQPRGYRAYCANCGVHLRRLVYDIGCDKRERLCYGCLSGKGEIPACCQIPFPNMAYLNTSPKPHFSLSLVRV